ncbi:transposase [Streptomyces sp. NPDC048483]|uniref:transposase n=1 Tax=Streptomyces sp. NPDC048483 TaxID=3154927 RepID=UPI003433B580
MEFPDGHVVPHREPEGLEEGDHSDLETRYFASRVAVPKLVNSLKGISARYLRRGCTAVMNRAIMHRHLCSPSYFSASCGGAPLAIIRQYIEQQQRPLRPAGQSSLEMREGPALKGGAFTQDHR